MSGRSEGRPPLLCSVGAYCNAMILRGELGPRCPRCDDSERWVVFWSRVLGAALTPQAVQRAEIYK